MRDLLSSKKRKENAFNVENSLLEERKKRKVFDVAGRKWDTKIIKLQSNRIKKDQIINSIQEENAAKLRVFRGLVQTSFIFNYCSFKVDINRPAGASRKVFIITSRRKMKRYESRCSKEQNCEARKTLKPFNEE